MSIVQKAFKQGSWLAIFKLFTQIFSWASTVIVARLLVPGDYGLMAMATILTGYAALFSEMGLGAAIIQRPVATRQELSSVFWFAMGMSLLFAGSCFYLAYPTAYIFDEPRVIPLTQVVSVIFLINGLQIVPFNLIKKQLEFKQVGIIEMAGSLVSCAFMICLAYAGAGVWTLLLGHIIRSFTHLMLVLYFAKWVPTFYFSFCQVKTFVAFGLVVATGRTFNYVFEMSDRFFAGRAWQPTVLGYYTFALQLAQIPTEKIVSLINQVSFSAFSELQHDKKVFNDFYLKVTKVTAMFVFPLFLAGYLLGGDLIKVLLDDKWLPIIFLFKILCLSQIFTAMTPINSMVNVAQGRPHWPMYFRAGCALCVGGSFYFAVQHGLNAILVPWLTIFPCLCLGFITVTVKKIGINLLTYAKNLYVPFFATLVMSLTLSLVNLACTSVPENALGHALRVCFKIAIGGVAYVGTFFVLDSTFLKKGYNLLKTKELQHQAA